VTFDDALHCVLEHAVPVLEAYGVPASIFVVTDNLGERPRWAVPSDYPHANERTMTADELVRLAQRPLITIGSHTCTHPHLSMVSEVAARRELVDSRARLEELIERTVDLLALPYGDGAARAAIAREAGYRHVLTVANRTARTDRTNLLLGRFMVSPETWPLELRLIADGAYGWLGPFQSAARYLRMLLRGGRTRDGRRVAGPGPAASAVAPQHGVAILRDMS
jgi:peptidoglycan/xylan/chitin deacetylase (PgdA/CDA1 family)